MMPKVFSSGRSSSGEISTTAVPVRDTVLSLLIRLSAETLIRGELVTDISSKLCRLVSKAKSVS